MKLLKRLIKQNIIAFLGLCFLVGVVFIWVGGAYNWIHLTDGEKLNSTVLWLTALAIFWYAYETYQLKMSTSEQVAIQEVIMQNEFLPILEPVAKGRQATLSAGRFKDFQVRNLGRGPAKYVELHIGALIIPLEWSLAGGEHEILRLPAAARRELASKLQAVPTKVRLRIIYQDIYKRKFQTQNIIFDKAPRNGTYHLREGSWDFKRIRT